VGSHPSLILGDSCTRISAFCALWVATFRQRGSWTSRGSGNALLSLSRSITPLVQIGSVQSRDCSRADVGWIVRPGVGNGRGFVGFRACFVCVDGCISVSLTVIPSGLVGCVAESDPTCLQDGTVFDWATATLGWLEPNGHGSGLAREDGDDPVTRGMYACISWWSQLGNVDH